MNDNHRELLSICLTVAIVLMALFVVHRFIPSLLWASIISIATFPLYKKWLSFWKTATNMAAISFTFVIALILILPISWLFSVLVHEIQLLINHMMKMNAHGQPLPEIVTRLPFAQEEIETYWNTHFAVPGGIKKWLSELQLPLTPTSYYLQKIGASVFHRSVQLGFTILSLFFFYRDGEKLLTQVDKAGAECLGERWSRYAHQLPRALQATVNGTIFVGISVGVIMGFIYWAFGFPAPALAGFFTAVAAMIPFAVCIVFLFVALGIWFYSSFIGAFILIVFGTLVMFIADHFIKPALIGGTTKLPFLAVLFGILGGVETLGILGLFAGPIIMVLFVTLWQELLV